MDKYRLEVTLTEQILGAVPKDPEVYKDWIAGQAALTDEALAEELGTVEKVEEKGWTGFHMDDGVPLIYDYVIKGFFKSACYFMRQAKDAKCKKLQAFKKKIDGLIMVYPRRIPLVPSGAMTTLERPLRAETAKGPRVALARSDSYPAGTTLECEVWVLAVITEAMLREWLDYGQFMGLGQWRSGGYGRFTYTLTKLG